MNSSRVLGVAIQGAGNVSTEHIRAYQRNPHTEVVAIGSRREEGARAKAAQMGLECKIDGCHVVCFAADRSAAQGGAPVRLPLEA